MKEGMRVLVIDSETNMTKDIEKYFSSHEEIKVVACLDNGEDGLKYILDQHRNIDVIIMDIIIPKLDGIFILEELEKRNINKHIIITTGFKDLNILEEVNKYGVDYYMLKPINFMNLENRILSVNLNKENDSFNQEAMVTDLLHKLGIPSHIRGYQFIKEGIKIVCKNGNNLTYITKDVYPEIAKKFNTTATRVERSIRHAIEISWDRGDIELMDKTFGNSVDINRDKPTNSEFLTTIADRIKFSGNLVMN